MSLSETVNALHVDDEPDFAEMAATFMERESDQLDVDTATSASEALDRLAADGYDCVISDYDMPGTNGIEFLEAVRESHPDLPFILFTGKGSEEVASEAISAGVTDYLQKEGVTDQYAILANRIRNYVERTRAQNEREAMRKRMELALKHTDSVIFELDLDTGEVMRHGEYDQFFDLPPGETPTYEDHLERAVHPEDREEFRRFYEQLMNGDREAGTLEYRTSPDSGRVRWIKDTVHVEDENPRQAIGLAQDTTANKEQSEKRDQIIERVTDAIVEVDADWQFTVVNDHAEELYGMDAESLLDRDFWDVFSGALGTRFEKVYREVMETREPASFVEYYDGLDGWFDVQVYPNEDGGLAFYFRDVTDRRERERERERAEVRFRTLAENFPNGAVHYFDDDLRYHFVAGRGFDPIDTSSSDLEGKRVADVEPYSEEIVETIESLMQSTLEGTEETTEVSYEDHVYELRSVPLPDADGEVAGGFFISQDVTDRRRRERALERKNERLEEFANFVAHDLRNPLTVAEGWLDLAREDCESEHIEDATRAIERSQALIDDLLSLAREGDELGTVESVGLSDVLEDCRQTVETGDATIETNTDVLIRANRSRLQQLLSNLLRNAVEHGGQDVAITVGDLDDDQGFYVADDGPGIPETEHEQVFEMGHSSRDDGTGFGLAIVEQVAEAHGWDIRLTESEAGGVRFELVGVDVVE